MARMGWKWSDHKSPAQHKVTAESWTSGIYCPIPACHAAIARALCSLPHSPAFSLTVLQNSFGSVIPSLALPGQNHNVPGCKMMCHGPWEGELVCFLLSDCCTKGMSAKKESEVWRLTPLNSEHHNKYMTCSP